MAEAKPKQVLSHEEKELRQKQFQLNAQRKRINYISVKDLEISARVLEVMASRPDVATPKQKIRNILSVFEDRNNSEGLRRVIETNTASLEFRYEDIWEAVNIVDRRNGKRADNEQEEYFLSLFTEQYREIMEQWSTVRGQVETALARDYARTF